MKILLITLVMLVSIGFTTEMGDLAASMKAGTWAELPTNNMASVIEADGAMRCILPYADGGAWEPGSESFYFIGSDHQHSTGWAKFAHYSAKTNSWREMPRPPFFGSLSSNAMHGYDHTAINVSDGLLYHIRFINTTLQQRAGPRSRRLPAIFPAAWVPSIFPRQEDSSSAMRRTNPPISTTQAPGSGVP
jgi:hypothetical protein